MSVGFDFDSSSLDLAYTVTTGVWDSGSTDIYPTIAKPYL